MTNDSGVIVPGFGPRNTGLMIVGERPGSYEAAQRRPFVGPTGQLLRHYLSVAGLHAHQFYMTNLVKDYHPANASPTPADVARWTPELVRELAEVKPRYLLAVGAHAARWFVGEDIAERGPNEIGSPEVMTMAAVHGLPFHSDRAPGTVVIPTYHPAFALHGGDEESLTWLNYDFNNVGAIISGKLPATPVTDEFAGREHYIDVTGRGLESVIDGWASTTPFALDTEGLLNSDWFWSIQVTADAGIGYILRASQPDFARGIAAIRRHALSPARPVTFIHSSMHDFYVCRQMGLDLFDCNLWDTRYAAYVTRIEPPGLKPLARRLCGMVMQSYNFVVGNAGLEKQLAFLGKILERTWPKPESRIEHENDGTSRLYTPQPVAQRAEAILVDFYSDKRDKEGNPVDPLKRWKKVDRILRRTVEHELGPMPVGTLADVPLDTALRYAGRDPDATLRIGLRQMSARDARYQNLCRSGNAVLPVFEEMQSSGMLADRAYCEKMSEAMWTEMCRLQSHISHRYYGGKPFNPNSPDQVAALMRRRVSTETGEQLIYSAVKKTKKGKVSTSKKSIEHLRYTDTAIESIIDWREHQKMRDSFYRPIIGRIGDADRAYIHTDLNPYKVTSRRISSSDPNLTAIPVRNELGVQVRDGFVAEDGYEYGSWDLSQAEMRVMAGLSGDPLLRKMFLEKRDPHAETAARIFGIDIRDVKEMEHRYPSKRAGFGIITNIQGVGLLDQLRMFGCKGWDEDKCDELIAEWLKIYKGVARFLEDCKEEVRAKGVIHDYWGMPRYLSGVWSHDRKTAAEAERAGSSHKIQGGAQGMIQQSMIWVKPYIRALRDAGEDVRWVLQIHDSVMFHYRSELWDTINPLIHEALTQHHNMKLGVPMDAKASRGTTWGKLH